MAVWQYTFNVIPKKSVDIINRIILDENGLFDEEPYWIFSELRREDFESLGSILPIAESWSKQLDMYGDESSNVFEVYHHNGRVKSISFRIDKRSINTEIINNIAGLLQEKELVILDISNKVIEPTGRNIHKVMLSI